MDTMTVTEDGRRARGAASRSLVMGRAVNLASVNGLDGLSIGDLAADTAAGTDTRHGEAPCR